MLSLSQSDRAALVLLQYAFNTLAANLDENAVADLQEKGIDSSPEEIEALLQETITDIEDALRGEEVQYPSPNPNPNPDPDPDPNLKLKLSNLNWKYGRHGDTNAPVVRDQDSPYQEIVLLAETNDHPSYGEETIRQHALFAANAPAMLRQALHACLVIKEAIEDPDLDEGSRTEALRDGWRYLNHAIHFAAKCVDLKGIETNIQEPPSASI